ncbi:MAG TPA: hypothetical protein DCL70_00770, partial [Kocuria sp.]|nr:hypothetical protein [Kocuria sp.]
MSVAWDLRLLPVALAVWGSAAATLAAGRTGGAVCTLAVTVLVPVVDRVPRWARLTRGWAQRMRRVGTPGMRGPAIRGGAA